jgi:two-component system, chemotaxis family, protein-glutamate methylesterase/glutaminase
MNVPVAPPLADAVRPRLRVMIVDDAVVVRGLFSRWVAAEPDLDVVACLCSGAEALQEIDRAKPDVVVLDVAMPGMDGIEVLPKLLEKRPGLVVLMASTLTRRNAQISLRALALGAADYIPKPAAQSQAAEFRRELVEKIRQLGLRRKKQFSAPAQFARPAAPFVLRPMPSVPPRALVIGASTGGPQALEAVLTQIPDVLAHAPVLITQHMPPTFTAILAEHLARVVCVPVREAKHGEEIVDGHVYVAPGGRHMRVVKRDRAAVISIEDDAPIHFCRPAVDPLFSSAAQTWGKHCLALVLTGMGHDGLAGAHEVVSTGGSVVAQDEPTSVVWGMPGQVAQAGLCSAVLPLPEIAPRLNRLFAGARS